MTFITKDNKEHKEFKSGMMRDTNKGKARFDLLHILNMPYKDQPLTRFAELLARGAEKYAERNREKANSLDEFNRFIESANRHFEQRICGERDEDHMAATWFNMMGAEMVMFKLKDKTND